MKVPGRSLPTATRHGPTITSPCPEISTATWTLLHQHLSTTWQKLTRDTQHALSAAVDPKTADPSQTTSYGVPVYVSAREDPAAISARLKATLLPADFARIRILPLPDAPEHITEHGLLFLPGSYVVPGGRFNELYGWDSYFIALGLLRDGRTDLARSIADQCLYEVEHYGAVLNCNRTYCLTRSHPPFLSRLVRCVFNATGDTAWLASALPLIERYYAYWQSPPHFTAGTGLSRYHALGEGPAPEAVASEVNEHGLHHYQHVCNALRDHPSPEPWFSRMYDPASHTLTHDGYMNDRTVRESGFDLTHRFGFCGLASRDYLPVCLNSLLYAMETDIAAIRRTLGRSPDSVASWQLAATTRAAAMHDRFWDEPAGLFLDWNLADSQRSSYAFATTFMPLWAGWATPDQASQLAKRLPDFMAPGGLLTSLATTGCQWDAPFTWAPLVHVAARGFAAYGFEKQARDISLRFVHLAVREFERTGQLFEKYDAVQQTADVSGKIHFGYPTNEQGFGWTNGVLADLLATL